VRWGADQRSALPTCDNGAMTEHTLPAGVADALERGLAALQLAPDAEGRLPLAWCDPELGDAGRWHLHEWQAAADFRAALAWHVM